MNKDHAVAGATAFVGGDAVSTVLQHYQGLDAATANAEAALVLAALAALYQLALLVIGRWLSPAPAALPTAPELPAPVSTLIIPEGVATQPAA